MKYFFTKYRFFLSGAALILTAASCTSTLSDEPATDARAISFTPAAETRAAVEGGTLPADFLVWGGYSNTLLFEGETVHPNGSYENGTRYWVPGTYNFYAVYPATIKDKTTFRNGSLTVKDFDCFATGNAAVDLMTAIPQSITYEAGNEPQPVAMEFKHELAKVEVSVRTDQGVTATIKNAKLTGMVYKGTLTATSNSSTWAPITSTSDETPYQVTEPVKINTPSTTSLFGDILIIPQKTDKLTLNIAITRDKKENTYNFDLGTSIAQWTAGRSYRYVLTIEADAITFSDFTVDEWGETHTGGDINIGTSDN